MRGPATATRRRLDVELHRRGLVDSRHQAKGLIEDRQVLVSGAIAEKAARMVGADEPIELRHVPRFVGRGGEKLAAALERFALDVTGWRALDAGSSTGGFTDALLQAGATSVVAVDVGTHQLHERLRTDDRVDVREQTDIRSVTPDDLDGGAVDVVVADLSFISIAVVADALVGLVAATGHLVVLVKPQFEAGRAEVSRGRGVIRDPQVWRETLDGAVAALGRAGAAIMEVMVSPIRGGDGNAEFLLHARPLAAADPTASDRLSARLDAVVAEAAGDADGPEPR